MRKMAKFLVIVALGTLVVCLLGSAIAIGERTYGYITRQNFSFGEALRWATEDYNDWVNATFYNKEEETTILEFPIANWNIEVTACTSH